MGICRLMRGLPESLHMSRNYSGLRGAPTHHGLRAFKAGWEAHEAHRRCQILDMAVPHIAPQLLEHHIAGLKDLHNTCIMRIIGVQMHLPRLLHHKEQYNPVSSLPCQQRGNFSNTTSPAEQGDVPVSPASAHIKMLPYQHMRVAGADVNCQTG